MRFNILREAFLKPLKAVSGVVERKHMQSLPILLNVLIRVQENRFYLTTTDQEVELIAGGTLDEPSVSGMVTVPIRKLMDIGRTLPEGSELSIIEEQDRIIIRSGRSRFTLSTLPASDFPVLDEQIGQCHLSIPRKELRSLIEKTCFAMAEQDVRYYLNGMLLEVKKGELCAVAADGHRLALGRISAPLKNSENLRVIIPRKGVLELQRILDSEDEMVNLSIGTNHIRAMSESITLTSKLLEGRFPDYDRIIPTQGDKVVIGRRENLKEAFHRASALFSDKFRGVRLRLTEGCLKILATNTEQDEVEEDVEVDYGGGELEIAFNVKYLIDLLNVIQTETVQFTFSDSNSSARVEGVGEETGTYVIMPMRI